jgi:hypothetical protein
MTRVSTQPMKRKLAKVYRNKLRSRGFCAMIMKTDKGFIVKAEK